jgi:hypothetical protein
MVADVSASAKVEQTVASAGATRRGDTRPYTQVPSEVVTACDRSTARGELSGGGFWTHELVGASLDQWRGAGEQGPASILIDLRGVAGYESGFRTIALELLEGAQRCGAHRIAFVASSAALRLAATALARSSRAHVRVFPDDTAAKRWLDGRG